MSKVVVLSFVDPMGILERQCEAMIREEGFRARAKRLGMPHVDYRVHVNAAKRKATEADAAVDQHPLLFEEQRRTLAEEDRPSDSDNMRWSAL